MKLAEALILRADLQKQLMNLKNRINQNLLVQEGEETSENPYILYDEIFLKLNELEDLILRINKTNSDYITSSNESISDLIVKRDMIGKKINILKEIAEEATVKVNRYSQTEIKIFSTMKVDEIQREINKYSKEYRELDTKLQGLNWTIDLIE
ncbi:DIP1984 family protein [Clostridium sp. LIBA-8841]|uniref:DIP1984 family protein n=1 Tax=Clostridium sp. LIBA-8841 TaxID=2987530 RepID=UPI002AC44C04|nr:DIP1984 family protein [Clostridium sp. LIBA-8841]MDZ5255194.1 DIP1984 family protein [Clostridium sp. LIBA-8841]